MEVANFLRGDFMFQLTNNDIVNLSISNNLISISQNVISIIFVLIWTGGL